MMRRTSFLLASLSLALAYTYAGAVHAMLINGSFETGDYTGWTLHEDSGDPDSGTWGIASDGQTIDVGDSVFDFFDGVSVNQTSFGLPITYVPTDGNFMSFQLQNDPETHRMYQDITLSSAATALTWDMFYTNSVGVFTDTQFLAVYLRDTADVILDTLFMTETGDPVSIGMTSFAADVSGFAGQTVRLDVFLEVQRSFFDAGFDNFRIAGIPEPATAALLGLGLAGFGFRRRRLR